MATIQSKKTRGYKYWYIVESRRVNGKPRPVVLAYLGTAESLLEKLKGDSGYISVKSYSHGEAAALLQVAQKLDVVNIINNHICSVRPYFNKKPVRNNLTAGATFLLGAIGRVSMLTSKRGWYEWARTTSLEYLLRSNFSKVDSQHFWDMMDSLPAENIAKAEEDILKQVFGKYQLSSGTVCYDTTNFYTYIATTNENCTIAQRGKNKQKRADLKQYGMALVVTKEDLIPLYHHTYQGNINDSIIFKQLIINIIERVNQLGLSLEDHTFVFDRGNNSKRNMALIRELKIYYVGALTPCHHKDLMKASSSNFQKIQINGEQVHCYREKREIWGEQRTVIVFISDRLKQGQIRGLYRDIEKAEKNIQGLQDKIAKPQYKNTTKKQLEKQVDKMLPNKVAKNVIEWDVEWVAKGRYKINYRIKEDELKKIEDKFGFRIIMTNRHDWDTQSIIRSYYGQASVEEAFKRLKNPYHLPVRPQFHWTDQKIKAHNFICVLGYLLITLIWKDLKQSVQFRGSINTLCNILKNVRLVSVLEQNKKSKKPKVVYKLEEMNETEKQIIKALDVAHYHNKKIKINGFGVYK